MKKFKSLTYMMFLLVLFVSFIPSVFADDFKFCREGTLTVFKAVGIIITIIKILVPLIIIILGTIDFAKAIVASDDKAIKESSMMLLKRAIAGIIIFFIPTIINVALGLVTGSEAVRNDSDFLECTNCMLDINSCNTGGSNP